MNMAILALMSSELTKACEKYGFALELGDLEQNQENTAIQFSAYQVGLDPELFDEGSQRIDGALVVWSDGSNQIDIGHNEYVYHVGSLDGLLRELDARKAIDCTNPKNFN